MANGKQLAGISGVTRIVALALAVGAPAAQAAEGFQVRYNLAGTLSAELFAPVEVQGWVGTISRSDARTDKVTGPDGGPLTQTLPGGSVTTMAGTTVYAANPVQVAGAGSLTQYNVLLAYVTPQRFAGGRLGFAVNFPYIAKKVQTTKVTGRNPNAVLNGVTNVTNTPTFTTFYQGRLAALGTADSGEVDGVGDVDVQAGWVHRTETVRWLVGASLVIPTGSYSRASGPDVSLGNFYTLRPAVQVVWLPRPDVSLGGRVTYGISSRNSDTHVRSGNWAGLEGSAGWRTPVGVVGLHGIMARQVQDDSGNTWGPSRYRADHAGLFYVARIESIGATLSTQYMKTLSSRNARHGRYLQIRLAHAF